MKSLTQGQLFPTIKIPVSSIECGGCSLFGFPGSLAKSIGIAVQSTEVGTAQLSMQKKEDDIMFANMPDSPCD